MDIFWFLKIIIVQFTRSIYLCTYVIFLADVAQLKVPFPY